MSSWLSSLFFYFGFFAKEDPPPPPEPEPQLEWPEWPFALSVKFGPVDVNLKLNIFVHVLLAAFVGAVTSIFAIFIAYRYYFNKKRQTSSSDATTDHHESSNDRPRCWGDHDQDYSQPPPNMNNMERLFWNLGEPVQRPRHRPQICSSTSRLSNSSRISLRAAESRRSQCEVLYQIENAKKVKSSGSACDSLGNFAMQCNSDCPFDDDDVPGQNSDLVLHQFTRGRGNPCLVPSGLKLESILRMCGIYYSIVFDCDQTGPWVSFGNKKIVGQRNIIKFLQKNYPNEMSKHVAPVHKKVPAWYITILLDSHLCWGITFWRWMIDEGKEVLANQPNHTQVFGEVKDMIKTVRKSSRHNYIGQMTGEEILDAVRCDLTALTASLGNKNHMIGENFTEIDCSAFAILAQLLWSTPGSQFEKMIREFPHLVKYCMHIRDHLWPDWDKISETRIPSDTGRGVARHSALDHGSSTARPGFITDADVFQNGGEEYLGSLQAFLSDKTRANSIQRRSPLCIIEEDILSGHTPSPNSRDLFIG